jgi:hypothetical protein
LPTQTIFANLGNENQAKINAWNEIRPTLNLGPLPLA